MTRADLNIGTRFAEFAAPAHLSSLLARSVAALPFLPREGTARGFRIFSLKGMRLAYCDLAAGSHVVIGRHSLADVVLHAPSTALRHVVLWATRRNGRLALRGQDLVDGTPIRTGPVFDGAQPLDLQGPLSLWVGHEPVVALPDFGVAKRHEPKHLAQTTEPRSLIRFAPPSRAWLTLDLVGPQGVRRLERTQQALERAILIGRYPRCEDGSGSVFSEHVSRVHAMIVRDDHEGVLVLDLRSTSGLQSMGRAVRSVRVTSHARIQLGDRDAIEVNVNRETGE